MRIGLVLADLPQYSETFFKYKIRGLIESGHEVIVFTSGISGMKPITDYKVKYSLPVKKGNPILQSVKFFSGILKTIIISPSRVSKLIGLERNEGKSFLEALKSVYLNSHIITEDLDRLHFGFATTALRKENIADTIGARMSVSFRGFDINVYPLKNPGCYDLLWKKIDKVHTISDYLHNKAVKLGLPESIPYSKITPAIDLTKFRLKTDRGKFHEPVRIITVGRLNWIKDYETAISSLAILRSKGIEFNYEIIGDGKELERIRFAVYQSGLDDCVKFLGKITHDEIVEKMEASDIYLQTSLQEGFCVSVLEAQAMGLICVVSDADGLRENVVNGVTGFIAERRRPRGFSDKMLEISRMSESDRIRISDAARSRVEDEFGIEKQNRLFNEFFLN
jgi:colanic acid/amylovoran biosynthesis glycosyltransferase